MIPSALPNFGWLRAFLRRSGDTALSIKAVRPDLAPNFENRSAPSRLAILLPSTLYLGILGRRLIGPYTQLKRSRTLRLRSDRNFRQSSDATTRYLSASETSESMNIIGVLVITLMRTICQSFIEYNGRASRLQCSCCNVYLDVLAL